MDDSEVPLSLRKPHNLWSDLDDLYKGLHWRKHEEPPLKPPNEKLMICWDHASLDQRAVRCGCAAWCQLEGLQLRQRWRSSVSADLDGLVRFYWEIYPLVMTNIAIENGHLQLIFQLKMVIFHSYVSLPRGYSMSRAVSMRKSVIIMGWNGVIVAATAATWGHVVTWSRPSLLDAMDFQGFKSLGSGTPPTTWRFFICFNEKLKWSGVSIAMFIWRRVLLYCQYFGFGMIHIQ